MKPTRIAAPLVAALFGLTMSSHAEFQELWMLGIDNDTQSEFAQERDTNAAPGSATLKDDDYYFAGVYPDPIGTVEVDELQQDPTDPGRAGLYGFERAVTSGDPDSRIHFNLGDDEVAADFKLNVDFILGGTSDGRGYGTHDIEVSMNGNPLTTTTVDMEDQLLAFEFSGDDAGAVGGENTVQITRTGGSAPGAWIQFDFISMEIDRSGIACSDPICSFTGTQTRIEPGESLALNWFTSADATLSIDQGIGSVPAGSGTTMVSPTVNTTYTLASDLGGTIETAEFTVEVGLLTSFTSDVTEVLPEAPDALLSWQVDPAAGVLVEIDNDVGDVTGVTAGGVGSITVSPTSNTIYTITVTRPNTPENDVSTQTVSVDYNNFDLLWIVGNIDDSQGEFSQENGNENDVADGSPTVHDDDYFLAGDYGGAIGVVTADEDWLNFDRAIASNDLRNRFHFVLTPEQAASDASFRLTVDLFAGGWWDADAMSSGIGYGTHDVTITVNGNEIFNQPDIIANTFVREVFSGEEGAMVEGENIIEVTRTGGDSKGDGGNSGWIQFDYTQLDVAPGSLTEFAITDITYNSVNDTVLLTFPSSPGQTFIIESSPTMNGDWTEEDDSFEAEEDEDSSTYVYDPGGPLPGELFFRVTRN